MAWLETSPLGEWMRSSTLAYPVSNVVHLFGLVLLVGPILMLDLRLLGFARQFELPAVSTLLTRWALVGLVLLATAGFMMFTADAGPLASNVLMQTKLALILLGLTNAVIFRWLWQRKLSEWDATPPPFGRLQALGSILVWLCVATLGRWIAYA